MRSVHQLPAIPGDFQPQQRHLVAQTCVVPFKPGVVPILVDQFQQGAPTNLILFREQVEVFRRLRQNRRRRRLALLQSRDLAFQHDDAPLGILGSLCCALARNVARRIQRGHRLAHARVQPAAPEFHARRDPAQTDGRGGADAGEHFGTLLVRVGHQKCAFAAGLQDRKRGDLGIVRRQGIKAPHTVERSGRQRRQLGQRRGFGLAVTGKRCLHLDKVLADDLLFGPVGNAAFHAFGDDRVEFCQPFDGARRHLGLRAGLFGAHEIGQALIDALVHLDRQRDGGHFDIGGGIGAFGLARAVVKQRLLQQQIGDQPG